MAIHVGEDHDDVRPLDDRGERFPPTAVHVTGVELGLVPATLRDLRVAPSVSIQTADDTDSH